MEPITAGDLFIRPWGELMLVIGTYRTMGFEFATIIEAGVVREMNVGYVSDLVRDGGLRRVH